jgi:hypothetical protein
MTATTTGRIRTVTATRYVTPLREGGSLPGLMEADDDGLYVVKYRGAGQGPKALIAELIAGELGRLLGLPVPELVRVELPAALASGEPDPEIQALLAASAGLNLGLDFLPGALAYDPAARRPIDPAFAADVVWFDAFVANVDRTARNTNLLWWGDRLWLIDHGAALYVHHRWGDPTMQARRDFPAIREHVLLAAAGSLVDADARLAGTLDDDAIWSVLAPVPDEWLGHDADVGNPDQQRAAYLTYLRTRLAAPRPFLETAERARMEPSAGAIDPERRTRGRRRE